jgi:hypothetical protein
MYFGDDEIDRPLCVVRCTPSFQVPVESTSPEMFLPWMTLAALDVQIASSAVSTFFAVTARANPDMDLVAVNDKLGELGTDATQEEISAAMGGQTLSVQMLMETRFENDEIQVAGRMIPFFGEDPNEIVFVDHPIAEGSGHLVGLAESLNEMWNPDGISGGRVANFLAKTERRLGPQNLADRWGAWISVCIVPMRQAVWIDPAIKAILESDEQHEKGECRPRFSFDPIDASGMLRVRLQDDEPPASPVGGW